MTSFTTSLFYFRPLAEGETKAEFDQFIHDYHDALIRNDVHKMKQMKDKRDALSRRLRSRRFRKKSRDEKRKQQKQLALLAQASQQQQQKQQLQLLKNNVVIDGIDKKQQLVVTDLRRSPRLHWEPTEQPRRSKRIQQLPSAQPKSTQQRRKTTVLIIRSKTVKLTSDIARLNNAINKVLSKLFLHPFRTPSEGGELGIIITFYSAYGAQITTNIYRNGYLRQSFSLSSASNHQVTDTTTTRLAFIYGGGTGRHTFGDSAGQLCCREMCDDLKYIRNVVQRKMEETYNNDSSVNTKVQFNTCEIISYYDNKEIPFHRDMTYHSDGRYSENGNSQIENTVVAILVAGDPRTIEFALFNFDDVRLSKATKFVPLSHACIFFLDPKDERDLHRLVDGEYKVSHLRHKSSGVKGVDDADLSIGFVFRACKTVQTVNKETGQYIYECKRDLSEKEKDREETFDRALTSYFRDEKTKEEDEESLRQLFLDMQRKYLV